MKEQLDEMNIPSRPGCCFRYSYRHTAGRRLNKHYSIVKNMTLRSSSSAAVTPPNHSAVRFCLHVCFNSKTFSFGRSPSLQMVFFCLHMYTYTLSRLIYKINHLENIYLHFSTISCSRSEREECFS